MQMQSSAVALLGDTFDDNDSPGMGHNEGNDIPAMTVADMAKAISDLKAFKAIAKGEIAVIRARIYIAEFLLLIPAMEQAYTHRNSNLLAMLLKGASLSGPMKRAVMFTIPNLQKVVDGKLIYDPAKTPPERVSEKTGALMPVWDESRWGFLKVVYHNDVVKAKVSPISDSWNEVFPSPDKTHKELLESFAKAIESAEKKGLGLEEMAQILSDKLRGGNLTE